MEIIEQLIPDLVNIVSDYFGYGIFPSDLTGLPVGWVNYDSTGWVGYSTSLRITLYNKKKKIEKEPGAILGLINQTDIYDEFMLCVICGGNILGKKYALTGDILELSTSYCFCCENCPGGDQEEYKCINEEKEIYLPESCFKYEIYKKPIMVYIYDGNIEYYFIDYDDKILMIRVCEGIFLHTSTYVTEITYKELSISLNRLLKK